MPPLLIVLAFELFDPVGNGHNCVLDGEKEGSFGYLLVNLTNFKHPTNLHYNHQIM